MEAMLQARSLPLRRPQRQPRDEVPLQQQEHDDGREGDQHGTRRQQVVIGEELAFAREDDLVASRTVGEPCLTWWYWVESGSAA